MTTHSILDPDCCQWQVLVDGWDLTWMLTVVSADDERHEVLVCERDDADVAVIVPRDYVGLAHTWFAGQRVAVHKLRGLVQFVAAATLDIEERGVLARAQGQLDRACDRTNWGGAVFPCQYDLRDAYDLGYQEGLA